jgi:hypothetical protein
MRSMSMPSRSHQTGTEVLPLCQEGLVVAVRVVAHEFSAYPTGNPALNYSDAVGIYRHRRAGRSPAVRRKAPGRGLFPSNVLIYFQYHR